ncbi:MAG: hypothetical protein SCH71_15200 [Desulfobulbaceae bacterium]|nr:hypothetical protein [Desulfobulbaceae bacterium]
MKSENSLAVVLSVCFLFILSILVTASATRAGGYPWKDHAKPYDFLFGNNIDTHQQSQIKNNGDLFGFLYITFTGENINGIPVAMHCNDQTPANECEVGWIIRGKFLGGSNQPTFVYMVDDHATWLVQSRNDIPQPGSYSHFHWLGDPAGGGGLVEGSTFDGYILELEAIDQFYFLHHNEYLLVMPGIDIATHVNIVGSFPGY